MYKLIEVGETMQRGDEFFNGTKKVEPGWEPVKCYLWGKSLEYGCWPHRRKISEDSGTQPTVNQQPKQYMRCPDCGNETFIYDIKCSHCGRVQWA